MVVTYFFLPEFFFNRFFILFRNLIIILKVIQHDADKTNAARSIMEKMKSYDYKL